MTRVSFLVAAILNVKLTVHWSGTLLQNIYIIKLKAHLHPRVIVVVCFYFESLFLSKHTHFLFMPSQNYCSLLPHCGG